MAFEYPSIPLVLMQSTASPCAFRELLPGRESASQYLNLWRIALRGDQRIVLPSWTVMRLIRLKSIHGAAEPC